MTKESAYVGALHRVYDRMQAGLSPSICACMNAWLTRVHSQHFERTPCNSPGILWARPCAMIMVSTEMVASRENVGWWWINVTSGSETRGCLYFARIPRLAMRCMSARVCVSVRALFSNILYIALNSGSARQFVIQHGMNACVCISAANMHVACSRWLLLCVFDYRHSYGLYLRGWASGYTFFTHRSSSCLHVLPASILSAASPAVI